MIGILVLLVLSWVIFYLVEKKSILLLGLTPPLQRLKEFGLGLTFFFLLAALFTIIDTILKDIKWNIQPYETVLILKSLWYQVKSVLTEELAFRGALLFVAIKYFGANRGLLLSSAAFGIYHWFSYGVLGNIVLMVFVFLVTGWMGYVWAYSYHRTKSIMLAVGGHLAWNFSQTLWKPNEPFGELLLAGEVGNSSGTNGTIAYLITGFIAPLLAYLFIRWYTKSKPTDR